MQQEIAWLHRPFAELIRLAWPIAVSMLSYSTMTMVDTLFVSRIGPSALAGVGLAGVTVFTLLCFSLGLLRGVKTLVAQAVGAQRAGEVRAYISAGVAVAVVLALVSVALAEIMAPLLRHLAASVEAGEHAVTYLSLRILGAPAFLVFVALREARYGQGDARTPMVASVLGNAVNITLDYVFVVVCGWGVAGVAWASVVANFVEVSVLMVIWRQDLLRLPRPRWAQVKAVWRIGVPTGGQFMLEIGSFTLLTVLVSAMSEIEMAAHQLVIHLMHFVFLPCNAVAEAGSVLAGQAVGADRDELVPGVARRAAIMAGVYSALCTVIWVALGSTILGVFTDSAELASTARTLTYIAALFLCVDSANLVLRGVLRGTGDVRYAAIIGIVCAWALTPPLTWLLGYELGMGVSGGWLGLCAEIVVCTVILWWRLAAGGWRAAAAQSRQEMSAAAA